MFPVGDGHFQGLAGEWRHPDEALVGHDAE